MIGIILQILAGLLGASAVWMVGVKRSWYKWGYVVGCVSQLSWLAMYVYYHQYWVMPVLLIYSWAWYNGLRNHWK